MENESVGTTFICPAENGRKTIKVIRFQPLNQETRKKFHPYPNIQDTLLAWDFY
jgi:hypothetical protein